MKKLLMLLPFVTLVVATLSAQTVIIDYETPGTSTPFQYFGSTLDGSLSEAVANPNPATINTSSTVGKFIKPAVAQTWAGAFTNPAPIATVDLTNGGQVCVKVHMDHIGNLALKLENNAAGLPAWITKISNTKVGEWEELCFDATVPSIESPFAPANGVYTHVVLFFDFGVAGTGTDVTSYFDDIVVKPSTAPVIRTINFQVDMNQYSSNFDQVYLSGNFNNWSGDANPLTDANFDGIWEGSVQMTNGLYEYKVTLDNWAAQEEFAGTEECTKTTDVFTNRLLLVSGDATLPRFCFNSCYACGEEINIDFKIGMNGETPNPEGVWLSGGGNFDVPGGKYKMSDDDLDGVYEISVPRRRGFSSYYAFANGPCADFSCKENLEGLPCGDPNNYFDRFLPAVQNDTVVATCYKSCATNTDCVIGTRHLTDDASLFSLIGNPAGAQPSLLVFGDQIGREKNVTLVNALGRTVGQWTIPAAEGKFDLNSDQFSPGLYFVTVRVGDRAFTRKWVK